MTGLVLFSVLALAAPRGTPAPAPDDPAALFAAAGRAYEAGRLPEARALYERVVAGGHGGVAARYNLGNTWWRLNRRGQAVLWWERARRLAPRDDDIRFNLKLARTACQDDDPALGEAVDALLPPAGWWWLLTGLGWAIGLVGGLALARGSAPARWRWVLAAGVPLALAVSLVLAWRIRDLGAGWAVVDVPQAEVRSGPGEQFPVGFTIPDGRRAVVVNRRPGWVEVGVPSQSLKGWLPAGSLAEL